MMHEAPVLRPDHCAPTSRHHHCFEGHELLQGGRHLEGNRAADIIFCEDRSSGLPPSHTTTQCCMKPRFCRLITVTPPIETRSMKGMSSCTGTRIWASNRSQYSTYTALIGWQYFADPGLIFHTGITADQLRHSWITAPTAPHNVIHRLQFTLQIWHI